MQYLIKIIATGSLVIRNYFGALWGFSCSKHVNDYTPSTVEYITKQSSIVSSEGAFASTGWGCTSAASASTVDSLSGKYWQSYDLVHKIQIQANLSIWQGIRGYTLPHENRNQRTEMNRHWSIGSYVSGQKPPISFWAYHDVEIDLACTKFPKVSQYVDT